MTLYLSLPSFCECPRTVYSCYLFKIKEISRISLKRYLLIYGETCFIRFCVLRKTLRRFNVFIHVTEILPDGKRGQNLLLADNSLLRVSMCYFYSKSTKKLHYSLTMCI